MQKFEYLESEKSFLDEIKNIFHSFWRAIIWWKMKISWKIPDTSFKVLALFTFKVLCYWTKLSKIWSHNFILHISTHIFALFRNQFFSYPWWTIMFMAFCAVPPFLKCLDPPLCSDYFTNKGREYFLVAIREY